MAWVSKTMARVSNVIRFACKLMPWSAAFLCCSLLLLWYYRSQSSYWVKTADIECAPVNSWAYTLYKCIAILPPQLSTFPIQGSQGKLSSNIYTFCAQHPLLFSCIWQSNGYIPCIWRLSLQTLSCILTTLVTHVLSNNCKFSLKMILSILSTRVIGTVFTVKCTVSYMTADDVAYDEGPDGSRRIAAS